MAKKLEELRELPVRKSNLLAQKARYMLTAKQHDIITYMSSKILPDDEIGKLYRFSIKEFCQITNIDSKNGWHYKAIKEELQRLADKSVWIPSNDGKKEILTRWFDEVMIDKGNGVIEVSFHKSMKPFFYELQGGYFQNPASHSYALASKYSKYLYDFLKSCENMPQRTISIEDFKKYVCPCKYTEYYNLRQRVLQPSIEEINKYTDITASFEPMKYKGSRKYNYITFTIKKENSFGECVKRAVARDNVLKTAAEWEECADKPQKIRVKRAIPSNLRLKGARTRRNPS